MPLPDRTPRTNDVKHACCIGCMALLTITHLSGCHTYTGQGVCPKSAHNGKIDDLTADNGQSVHCLSSTAVLHRTAHAIIPACPCDSVHSPLTRSLTHTTRHSPTPPSPARSSPRVAHFYDHAVLLLVPISCQVACAVHATQSTHPGRAIGFQTVARWGVTSATEPTTTGATDRSNSGGRA